MYRTSDIYEKKIEIVWNDNEEWAEFLTKTTWTLNNVPYIGYKEWAEFLFTRRK